MKISVTLPNKDGAKWINQAIDGIVNQTHKDIELIIIDDGSTDESPHIIRKRASEDPRIQAHFLTLSHGTNYVLNLGLQMSTGGLFCGSASDDWFSDLSFFENAEKMMLGSSAAGVYGISNRIDGDTLESLGNIGSGVNAGFIGSDRFLKSFLERLSFVTGYSAIWKTALLCQEKGYDYRLGPQADYWLNHFLASKYGAMFYPEVTTKVRIFGKNGNYSTNATVAEKITRHALFVAKLMQRFPAINNPFECKEAYIFQHWLNYLVNDLTDTKDNFEWISVFWQEVENHKRLMEISRG